MRQEWVEALNWNADELLPAIAQDADSGDVLMMAWMNRAALEQTFLTGEAVYWSRSRQSLWRKGEQSGHVQRVVELRSDCDNDALLLKVKQLGEIACHTGRRSCFFNKITEQGWVIVDAVLKNPKEIYK